MKPAYFVLICLINAGTGTAAQSNPVPFVNQPLLPTATAPGGPSFTLTVNGTGFVSGSTVQWDGTALTTIFVSSSQLTATVPAANVASNAEILPKGWLLCAATSDGALSITAARSRFH